MPRLSFDARRVLSGEGAGKVYVDGVVPPGLERLVAGGWTWFEQDGVVYILGNGSEDGGRTWHLFSYRFSDHAINQIDARGSTATYGGAVTWAAYLGSRPIQSYDNHGTTWTGTRVARGVSPTGTAIYTSPENDILYWGTEARYGVRIQTIQIGVDDVILWWDDQKRAFQCIGDQVPIAPSSGGVGARFTRDWICQWNPGLKALVVYPWQIGAPLQGYVLSRDEQDFNHDIGWRYDGNDGQLIVTTAVNQGETAIRVYEINLQLFMFRVNGGLWKMLELVSMDVPYVPPIDPPDPPIDPPDPPIDPPDPPVDPDTGGTVKVGQKGFFRMWGTTGQGAYGTVQAHQDAGYLSLQLTNGKFARFDPGTGLVLEPPADVAGGWERVTFDGNNIMVAQPAGGVILPYEWYNQQ